MLLGSSGAGKSTLANSSASAPIGKPPERSGPTTVVDDIRQSSAKLLALPGGALLIDTPGIREVSLWDSAEGAFSYIEAAAAELAASAIARTTPRLRGPEGR